MGRRFQKSVHDRSDPIHQDPKAGKRPIDPLAGSQDHDRPCSAPFVIVGNRISIVLSLAPQNLLVGVCGPSQSTVLHRKSGVRTVQPPQPSSFPQVSVMLTVKELGFDGDLLA